MIGDIFGTLFAAVIAYAFLLLLLRVTGKRSLSTMNAFDLIVTVALGSILARTVLSEGTTLLKGLIAFVILIGIEYGIEWVSTKNAKLRDIITADPSLLYHRGQFLYKVMNSQRVTEDDVRAAVRRHGVGDLKDVEAVVLENNGEFSVIRRSDGKSAPIVEDLAEDSP